MSIVTRVNNPDANSIPSNALSFTGGYLVAGSRGFDGDNQLIYHMSQDGSLECKGIAKISRRHRRTR